ncbi:MAG: dTDP-glucose 4,6-dehydratase [Dehalococcoidia bacterium]
MTTYLVTGGCGFIGSNFIVRLLQEHLDASVINLDKLTYAGNPDNLRDVADDPRYRFVQGDICDPVVVGKLMPDADYVAHFAAETHVDRSLMEPGSFIQTDVFGTYTLLEAARQNMHLQRFLHISTDEVYGEVLPTDLPSVETDVFKPRSPYSASKAGGEMQCRAYVETYDLPVVVARPANNVGPRQHVEKFVPLCATNAMQGLPLPIYGDGQQTRDRLFVEDHCEALDLLLHEGVPGEAYNIGAGNQRPNLEVAEMILDLLEKPRSLIRFVEDRAGHDRGYFLDSSKIQALGWHPRHDFKATLEKTVEWYLQNRWWWEKVRDADFQAYYEKQYGKRLAEAKPRGPD